MQTGKSIFCIFLSQQGGYMKQKFNSVKEKMNKLFQKFAPVKGKAEVFLSKLPKRKPHSEKYYKRIAFFNKYSLIFHFILACFITFTVEVISRRDFFSAVSFVGNHTWAYLYNAFIVFASLSIVYLFKTCLLYTSDAADEEDSVDFGCCRIIKKNNKKKKRVKQRDLNKIHHKQIKTRIHKITDNA